jgi:hypothetical protein
LLVFNGIPVKNYNIKYDFKNISDSFKLNYGINGIYEFNPGTIRPSNPTSGINFDQLDKKYAFEPSLYLGAEQNVSDKLSVTYGLRYSMFYRLRTSTVNYYADNNQHLIRTYNCMKRQHLPLLNFSAKTKSFKLIKLRTAIICSLSIRR